SQVGQINMLCRISCPECGDQFGWVERRRASRWLARKQVRCPSCNSSLIWSKWPWRIANGALLLGFASQLPQFINPDTHALFPAFIMLSVAGVAFVTTTLERAGSHSVQP